MTEPTHEETPMTQIAEPPAQLTNINVVTPLESTSDAQVTENRVPDAWPEEAVQAIEEARARAEELEKALAERGPKLAKGEVRAAPRCGTRNALNGTKCDRMLAVQVGRGTIIDCPKCRTRHEW